MAGDAIDEDADQLDVFCGDVLDGNIAKSAGSGLGLIAGAEGLEARPEPEGDGHGDAVHGVVSLTVTW